MALIVKRVQDFFKLDASAGIMLMLAAALALAASNSPLSPYYAQFLEAADAFGAYLSAWSDECPAFGEE